MRLRRWLRLRNEDLREEATREEQIAIAQRVRNSRGSYHAWPTCSGRLGLDD